MFWSTEYKIILEKPQEEIEAINTPYLGVPVTPDPPPPLPLHTRTYAKKNVTWF